MEVGEQYPDLRLGVIAGSAEQIHFPRLLLPLSKSRGVCFWGEQLSPPNGVEALKRNLPEVRRGSGRHCGGRGRK